MTEAININFVRKNPHVVAIQILDDNSGIGIQFDKVVDFNGNKSNYQQMKFTEFMTWINCLWDQIR